MVIQHYLQLIWHYKSSLAVASSIIISGITGLSVLLLLVFPMYTGSATVMMMPTEAELAFTKGWLSGSQFSPANIMVQTHMEYLLSRPVAERALDKIIATAPRQAAETEGWKASFSKGFSAVRQTIWRVYHTLNSGKYFPLEPHENALRELMGGIELEIVEGSFVLLIEVSVAKNAKAAAIATNELANAYVELVTEQAKESADKLETFLLQRINENEALIGKLIEKEFELRKELGILSLEEERAHFMSSRKAEEGKLQEDRILLAEQNARLKNLQEKMKSFRQQSLLANVEEEFAMGDIQVRTLEQRISLRSEALESIRSSLEALGEKEKPILLLGRQRDQLEKDIDDLLQRMRMTKLSQSSILSQVRIINPAVQPEYPSFPKVIINTIVGIVAALLLCSFGLVVADTVSGTIKTTVDLRRLSGERTLGRLRKGFARSLVSGRSRCFPLKKLRIMGMSMEKQLALVGDIQSGTIQVTGFVDARFLCDAGLTLAASLVANGNVVYFLPPPGTDLPKNSNLQDKVKLYLPDSELDSLPEKLVKIECAAPIGEGFSWKATKSQASVLICLVPSGEIYEDTILELKQRAEIAGINVITFVLIQ